MIDVVAPLSALLHNVTDQQPTDNNDHNDEICQALDDYDRYDQLLILPAIYGLKVPDVGSTLRLQMSVSVNFRTMGLK